MPFFPPPQLPLARANTRPFGVYWRPNDAFVVELSAWLRGQRVLEVCAGNGLLAAHLQQAGVQVRPTTIFSGHDAHEHGLYTAVEELEATSAVEKYGTDSDILLVSWPTATDGFMSAARRWGSAKQIVYIGEFTDLAKNQLGGCASDAFFDAIHVEHTFQAYRGNAIERAVVCRMRGEA